MKPEDREEWLQMMESPLDGTPRKPSDAELEAEGASFMALMGQMGQGA